MLRKFLLCTVASAALHGQFALAADLPVKAPPLPASAWSWAGFYLGAHGGYGWGRNNSSNVAGFFPTVTVESIDSEGWLAGGHAGYNWQSGRWVAGLEVDGSATGIRGDSAPAVQNTGGGATRTFIASDDVRYLGTARLRGGVVPFANENLMLYATAGLAWERMERTDINNPVLGPLFTRTVVVQPTDRFGWIAGAGGEFRLGATNWIGRVEYLHYDFGQIDVGRQFTFGGDTYVSRGGRQTIDVVRGGLSYKFGQPSAPLSAYAAYTPAKAVPSAAPSTQPWSWAGFYLGGHGGHGWARNDFALNPGFVPSPLRGVDSRGALAGAHGGYNWQSGRWVTGFEIDGSRTWIHGDTDTISFAVAANRFNAGDDVKYLGTVRSRLGVTPFAGSDVLLYGTAGLAWERFERSTHQDNMQLAIIHITTPRDHFGWVAGAGAEFRLGATNWIGRAEYLHYDFGTVETTNALATSPANPFDYTDKGGKHAIDVVRGGISYKFGSEHASSPAYAAYASVAPVAPVWSWTGYYLGAHGGYGWSQNDFSRVLSTAPRVTLGGVDAQGGLGGGHAGYNWQFDRWVAGLELDGSATRIRGDSVPTFRELAPGFTQSMIASDDVKYFGTLRARFGVVPFAGADVLLYSTAGLAWERVNRTLVTTVGDAQLSQTTTQITPRNPFGWVAGVGGEFRLGASNWIGRIEYLHYDFGTIERTTSVDSSSGGFADCGGRQTIDVVRGGVSYKFAATP